MAADLHIHAYAENQLTEEDFKGFFASTIGSKWYDSKRNDDYATFTELHEKFFSVPTVWIGEVSWLKAWLCEDNETFIPGPVQKVSEIIGEDLPVIDDALIEKITAAMDVENATTYSIAKKEDVRKFLETHKGKRVFTVSW